MLRWLFITHVMGIWLLTVGSALAAGPWFHTTDAGVTKGPSGVDELRALYHRGAVHPETLIWNGADVAQWTPLKHLPALWRQLKAPPKPNKRRRAQRGHLPGGKRPPRGDAPTANKGQGAKKWGGNASSSKTPKKWGGQAPPPLNQQPKPAPAGHASKLAKFWFYTVNQSTRGPVTVDDLRRLYHRDAITPQTLVWNGRDVSQWTPIDRLPALFRQLRAPPKTQRKRARKRRQQPRRRRR